MAFLARPTPRRVLGYLGLWLGLATLFSGQYIAEAAYDQVAIRPLLAFRSAAMFWAMWGIVGFPLAWLVAVTPRSSRPLRWTSFVLLAIAAGAMQIILRRGTALLTGWDAERSIAELMSSHMFPNLAVAFAIIIALLFRASRAEVAHEKARATAALVERTTLETELSRADLALLRRQLQPHFLLNTLQGIASLAHTSPDRAEAMLGILGDLLREVVQRPMDAEITLKEEIAFLRRYLELEQMRFESRLQVEIAVGTDVEQASVPAFLLQPMVENALRHGLAPLARGGTVRIQARRDGETLVMDVADDGVGLGRSSAAGGSGVGIANSRSRLQRIFADRHSFTVAAAKAGGTIATVRIPLTVAHS